LGLHGGEFRPKGQPSHLVNAKGKKEFNPRLKGAEQAQATLKVLLRRYIKCTHATGPTKSFPGDRFLEKPLVT
jgi:hypothetical protein